MLLDQPHISQEHPGAKTKDKDASTMLRQKELYKILSIFHDLIKGYRTDKLLNRETQGKY